MKAKARLVVVLVVVLTLAGLALRALVGSSRAVRGPSTEIGDEGARAELSGPAVEPLAEVRAPQFAEARTRVEAQPGSATTRARPAWWGRVLDGETGEPPARASFAVVRHAPAGQEVFAPVREDGHLVAPISTWNEEVVVVSAPGYATAFALASGAHRTREEAQRILLWRAATLEVHGTWGPGSTQQMAPQLRVWCADHELFQLEGAGFVAWDDFRWEGDLRADGALVFEGLPARTALTLGLRSGESGQREPIQLEPGEARVLTWRFGGQALLTGRAVDSLGAPVSELELWLLGGEREATFRPRDAEDVLVRSRTDADGNFLFTALAPGRYLVGPAPSPAGETGRFAPVGTPVTVGSAEGSTTLLLRLIALAPAAEAFEPSSE